MVFDDEGACYHCDHCGNMRFIDPIADEVPPDEQSRELDWDLECPVCEEVLTEASLQRLQIHHCSACRGILLRHQDFGTLVFELRRTATDPPHPQGTLDQSELEREIVCPVCLHPMHTHPYYGPGHIVIDSCTECGLVWLDGGELERVINAPGKDRGA
jgi:Zn-finger nucleic acid-binding protein